MVGFKQTNSVTRTSTSFIYTLARRSDRGEPIGSSCALLNRCSLYMKCVFVFDDRNTRHDSPSRRINWLSCWNKKQLLSEDKPENNHCLGRSIKNCSPTRTKKKRLPHENYYAVLLWKELSLFEDRWKRVFLITRKNIYFLEKKLRSRCLDRHKRSDCLRRNIKKIILWER